MLSKTRLKENQKEHEDENDEDEDDDDENLEDLSELEESKDSAEFYTMLMDTKLKEKCEPMGNALKEMTDKLLVSERTIKDLTNAIEKVD